MRKQRKKNVRKINYGRLFDKNTVSSKNFNFKTKANRTYHAARKKFPIDFLSESTAPEIRIFFFELGSGFWCLALKKFPSPFLLLLKVTVVSHFSPVVSWVLLNLTKYVCLPAKITIAFAGKKSREVSGTVNIPCRSIITVEKLFNGEKMPSRFHQLKSFFLGPNKLPCWKTNLFKGCQENTWRST